MGLLEVGCDLQVSRCWHHGGAVLGIAAFAIITLDNVVAGFTNETGNIKKELQAGTEAKALQGSVAGVLVGVLCLAGIAGFLTTKVVDCECVFFSTTIAGRDVSGKRNKQDNNNYYR